MIIIVIAICCLVLYGLCCIMPSTWEMIPELIASGDSIMSVALFSTIAAAIIAILIAIFKHWDGFGYSLQAFGVVCLAGIVVNSITANSFTNLLYAIVGAIIVQLEVALPIGIVTVIICALISYAKSSSE